MDTGDVISTTGLLAAAVGLVFTAFQIRRNGRVQRANFYKDLYESFFLDEQMRTVFELMESKQWKFVNGFGAGSDISEYYRRQRSFERLLAHLEVICSLYRRGLITKEDIEEFEYNIQRLVNYDGFDCYLLDLEKWRKESGLLRAPYGNLRWYIRSNRARLERGYSQSTEHGLTANEADG